MAPGTAAPPRDHWYVKETGDGPHSPGPAVSVDPTAAVPVTVGVLAVTV